MLVTETFHGYIETTQDVLLIFEGCRRGLLPRICRRLQERERKMIRSGSIFVFDERESGIKRWTDGRVWSPSRILGNFLIYRELDKKAAGEKKLSQPSMMPTSTRRSFSLDNTLIDRNKERQLIGSLSDSYRFKEDGLIKKTMSIIVNGVAQHLISYYDPNEVLQEKLRSPSSVPELASLEISPELLVKQNFRIPPLVEPTFDLPDHLGHHGHHQQGSLTPPDPAASNSYNRMIHPLRSMSVGSIRGHEQMVMRNEGIMYHPYQQQQQRMGPQSPSLQNHFQHSLSSPNPTNNIPANIYHHDQPHPQTSTSSVFPTTSTSATIPSPSTLTSSPSTPMLSPARYHQQNHQRHYSTSSISSPPLPRFDPRNYTAAAAAAAAAATTESFFDRQSQSNTMGQMMSNPSVDSYHHSAQPPQHNERFASPNIGQLLNPIHPLNSTSTNSTTNNNGNSANDHHTASSSSPSTPPPTGDVFLNHSHQQHPYDYNNVVNPTPTTSSSLRNSISHSDETSENNTQAIPSHHHPSHQNHRHHSIHEMSDHQHGDGVNGYYMNYYQRPSLPDTQIHNGFMFHSQH